MLLAFTALALATSHAGHAPDRAIEPYLCAKTERTAIFGRVQDDLGLDVAVCLSGMGETRTVTIRWSGEGGGDSVSCEPDACDGVIEYSRYTSPHLTILQLAWVKDGNVQRLYQTLERPDPSAPATSQTTHVWEPAGTARGEAEHYPVVTKAQPLALMGLEEFLTPKPATKPLLSGVAEQ